MKANNLHLQAIDSAIFQLGVVWLLDRITKQTVVIKQYLAIMQNQCE